VGVNVSVTKEFISKASLLKNLPTPLFSKEGYVTSLWQREVRKDFIINVFILMTLLVTHPPLNPLPVREGLQYVLHILLQSQNWEYC
jgi:hypothetical protein